ncbi:MAG: GIY-YIG nuclease family protein, partial [Pseudomonadota bacterium]
QSTHPAIQEATVKARPFMASFVQTGAFGMGFLGLYALHSFSPVDPDELARDETFMRMLCKIEHRSLEELRSLLNSYASRVRFKHERHGAMQDLQGRLLVKTPAGRNYMRLAEKTHLDVLEIKQKAGFTPPMPSWDEICLSKSDLIDLPTDWKAHLSQWRGIYLIVDQDDGARYVGSAYGTENLLGRWLVHVKRDKGVTVELALRNTDAFRFSILELVSPTAGVEEVVACERNWMHRLDTIGNGLNV